MAASTLNNLSYLCRLKLLFFPAHLFACKGCSAQAHLDALDNLALKLHAVLADGTVACVPHHNSNASVKPKVLIGWNNECAQLKVDSLFWHRLWVSGGRPNVGVVHDTMRSTQKRYYFAVKGLLRSQTDLRNACLAEASINKPLMFFGARLSVPMHGPHLFRYQMLLMNILIVMI